MSDGLTPKKRRAEIKRLLSLLDDQQRRMFVMMYSPPSENPDVYDLVDTMPAKRLPWALVQCQNSYYTLFKVIKSA